MAEGTKHPQKLLLFYLTNQRPFGLGTLKIREIMPFVPLTRLPHSHSAVIGTMSFRGSAVPVIDMAAAVGYPPLTEDERKTASIIVTDRADAAKRLLPGTTFSAPPPQQFFSPSCAYYCSTLHVPCRAPSS